MIGIGRVSCAVVLLACVAFAGGCKSHQTKRDDRTRHAAIEPAGLQTEDYEAVTASALVFDPPIAEYSAVVPTREGRERSAFVGYDSVITTYFYLRTDDRQRFFSDDGIGRYERRAVSERIGVSRR